jgi:hypothetical protein
LYHTAAPDVDTLFDLVALPAAAPSSEPLRRQRPFLLVLVLALEAAETLRVHPHELSFFNAIAGGPRGGRRLFADSNVDWGQDLARLADAAPRLGTTPMPAIVFAGDLPRRYAPILRPVAPGDADKPGALIAMGEVPFAIGPELLESTGSPDARRLRELRDALRTRGSRVAEIGGSIGIWRLEPARLTSR